MPPTPEEFATRINEKWDQMRDDHLGIASLAVEAQSQFKPPKLKVLRAKLAMHPSTFSKYAKIGACERLYQTDIRDNLPSRFTPLYALATTELNRLEQLIAQGLITPSLTAAGAAKLKRQERPEENGTRSEFAIAILVMEVSPESAEELMAFENSIRALSRDGQLSIVTFPAGGEKGPDTPLIMGERAAGIMALLSRWKAVRGKIPSARGNRAS